MRILLIEGEAGHAETAVGELERAGHEVTRCHDVDAPPFPCAAMTDDHECPLDEGPVDAALLVRGDGPAGASAREDGVRCSLRRQLPLVVAGNVFETPYADWATVIHHGTSDVVDAVEQAAQAPLARHTEAARRSLRSVLAHHDLPSQGADARVTRHGLDLHVSLLPPGPLPKAAAEMASVRAAGAVRDVDPYPRTIDVSVDVPA